MFCGIFKGHLIHTSLSAALLATTYFLIMMFSNETTATMDYIAIRPGRSLGAKVSKSNGGHSVTNS